MPKGNKFGAKDDYSRYGGGDLPTSKQGSNERAYNTVRSDVGPPDDYADAQMVSKDRQAVKHDIDNYDHNVTHRAPDSD